MFKHAAKCRLNAYLKFMSDAFNEDMFKNII